MRAVWLGVAACSLAAASEVTFTKDVAPILYRRCVSCHRTGDIAPMSLLTYREARPWAASIREAVVLRKMPPWHADPRYGHFANDVRLTDAEISTIGAWAADGAMEGNPADLPPAPRFADQWHIGKPDVVIDIGEDYRVESQGPDEYDYFTVPTNFTEDRWVTAVELQPGNRKVVHHAHVFLKTEPGGDSKEKKTDPGGTFMYHEGKLAHMKPDAPVKNDGCAVSDAGNYWGRRGGQNGILGSYLPGKAPDAYPEGTAKLVPAGSKLTFQVHYSRTTGKTETDRTRVGFVFAPGPPARPLRRMDISNYLFRIPAGEGNQEVSECHTFEEDIDLLSLTAHMHFRGKDMRFDLERPGSTERETLLFVPNYDFAWQTIYRLREPVHIPKGSHLIITAHFDNSPNNRRNPDPAKVIRWGEPSNEEMMDGWLEYVDPVAPSQTAAARP
jgi:hypothetical protein